MAHDVMTINAPRVRRAWSVPIVITPSDTNSEKNLEKNGYPYRFIQNRGTSGSVDIVWVTGTVVAMWFNQGEIYEGGMWQHARATNLSAGVSLVGLIGDEAFSR